MRVFLFSPLELIGVLAGLGCALPWAVLLLPVPRRQWGAILLLTLALSLGALTLGMLLLAAIGALRPGWIALGLAIVFGSGTGVLLRQGVTLSMPRISGRDLLRAARAAPLRTGAVLIGVGMGGLIALNALYWPFYADDAVSIYATQARYIFQARAVPQDVGLYDAYPMLLPLSHAYAYLVAGTTNEYLAKVAVAALGVGTLGAAWLVGRTLYDERTGIGAALLLALTPEFARWASTGYTDVPEGFFITLTAAAGWWLREDGSLRSALVLGLLSGLAAWTKNSALTLAATLGAWALYLTWRGRIGRRQWVALLAGYALTAGPWYARNFILWQRLVPRTAWSDQARHTLGNLLPFATHPLNFSVPGLLITIGLGLALLDLLRRDTVRRDRALLLLAVIGPFGAAWWWMASYDPRFLVAVLPVGTVLGADALWRAWDALPAARRTLRPAVQVGLVIVLIGLALFPARKAISFKGDLVRHPLQGDAARHRIVLGPIYDVALYLNALPVTGTVLSDTYLLTFQIERAGVVSVPVGTVRDRAALAQYDFLVLSPATALSPAIQPGDVRLLTEIDGFRVYAVPHTAEGDS